MPRRSIEGALLIFDRREDKPKRLLPLTTLIVRLERLFPALLDTTWICWNSVDGYGETVIGDLGERLETQQTVSVLGSFIWNAIRSGEQYFEDADFQVPAFGIDFGIFDSGMLFFRGTPEEMRTIASGFSDTRFYPG